MQENVGTLDRTLRSVVGPGLMVLGYSKLERPNKAALVAIVAGALLVESAVTRVCPLNALLGIDTRGGRRDLPARDQLPGDLGERSARLAVS